jgi:hypothetical protein
VAAAPRRARAGTLALDHPRIDSVESFTALSTPAGDLVANGRVVKFLVDLRTPATPVAHFVNGNFTTGGTVPDEAKYHYFFAPAALGIPESLGTFNDLTYFSPPSATPPASSTPTTSTASSSRSTACSSTPRTSCARTASWPSRPSSPPRC